MTQQFSHIGVINKANISYTRNHLSEMIARVREGETILIVDRDLPVARLEPIQGSADGGDLPWRDALVRRGVLRAPAKELDTEALRALPLPTSLAGGDILESLLADREEGR
jgi:antitoxin (DNA-binding transcriptional repressor) of toxin-antitoxin stability system